MFAAITETTVVSGVTAASSAARSTNPSPSTGRYVAVKPSQFEAFKAAEAGGNIDLYNFDAFGEVIVSAEGQTPPEEVTLKVAEMYGADAATFFQPIDPLAEIGKKIDEIKAREGD